MLLSDPAINTEIKKIVAYYGKLHPRHSDEIEDIVQTIICNAVRLGFTELSPSYLKTSIQNRIVNLAVAHRASKEHVSLDEFESLGFLKHSTPRDDGLDVRRAIDASHVSGVNVMHLYFIEGMDTVEIAEMTGKTKQGVVGKLNRQIKRVKKLLGDYEQNFSNQYHERLARAV